MFEAKLSQDGTKVVIVEEGKQKELTIKKFVYKYGTSILQENRKEKIISRPGEQLVAEYYAAIRDVMDENEAVEEFMMEYRHIMPYFTYIRREWYNNFPSGDAYFKFIRHERSGELHDKTDDENSNLWIEYSGTCMNYVTSIDILDYWSELVGFEPMPSNTSLYPDLDGEISRERFSRLLFECNDFRYNLKSLVEKYSNQGIAVSIYDLTNEALEMTW